MADFPTPAQVALVRQRYVDGASLKSIAAETGVARTFAIYGCLRGDHDDGSGLPLAPIPLRRPAVRIFGRNGSRHAVVVRLWRAAERQVDEIEGRLESAGLEPGERESNARTLATLTRTLRELAALDEAQKPRRAKTEDTDEDDDPVPRDLDEFRRELARRIEAVVRERDGDGGAGSS